MRREFLHSDDMADACVFLLTLPDEIYTLLAHSKTHAPLVNVGCGADLTVDALAALIRDVVGFDGGIKFDISKPDGTPRKLLDVSRIRELGWQATISLREGLVKTYSQYSRRQILTNP